MHSIAVSWATTLAFGSSTPGQESPGAARARRATRLPERASARMFGPLERTPDLSSAGALLASASITSMQKLPRMAVRLIKARFDGLQN